VCIEYAGVLPQIWGVLTDYKNWFFTCYDIRVELENARQGASLLDFEGAVPFEVS
jgi:hypothetical protein